MAATGHHFEFSGGRRFKFRIANLLTAPPRRAAPNGAGRGFFFFLFFLIN